jgi:hypothetical protein
VGPLQAIAPGPAQAIVFIGTSGKLITREQPDLSLSMPPRFC